MNHNYGIVPPVRIWHVIIGAAVVDPLVAINEVPERILLPWFEIEANRPTTISTLMQRMRRGIPIVKITN